jgi:histone H2A
MDLIVLLL